MSRISNPYCAGKPIDNDSGFFGREEIIAWVTQELRNQNTNCLVLFGQRRIGKTTLLLRLERFLPQDEYLPVVFDLQYQAQRSLGHLLFDLACAMAEKVGQELPQENEIVDSRGDLFKDKFLPGYLTSLPLGLRPVLLFDEFDVYEKTSSDVDSGVAGNTLFAFLAKIMSEYPMIGFVFVAGRNPDELSINYSSIFKQALVHEVWVLNKLDSERLIKQAENNRSLTFSRAAIDRIIELTNGHPYLTQLLCQRIWETAHMINMNTPPAIGLSEVDNAIENALAVGGAALEWWWNGLSIAERVYASAMAEATANNLPISEDQVITVLSANASRLYTRQVELAPKDLVKRRVLEQCGERQYKFAIDILGLWIRHNRNLNVVKEELDKINVLANQLYEAGRSYYQRWQLAEAQNALEDAIEENPQHLKAHLLLGDVYLDLNKPGRSIRVLQRASELDSADACLPLARAWIAFAKAEYARGREDEALSAVNRALEYSHTENDAQDLRSLILANQKSRKAIYLYKSWRALTNRSEKLIRKPWIFSKDDDPNDIPFYPRELLEDLAERSRVKEIAINGDSISILRMWWKFILDQIIQNGSPSKILGSVFPFALFIFAIYSTIIMISNTLILMGLVSPNLPSSLLRLDFAILGGVLVGVVAGTWTLIRMYSKGKPLLTFEYSDAQKKLYAGLAILVILFAVVVVMAFIIQREISVGSLASSPAIELILSLILFGVSAINSSLTAALTFQPASSGFVIFLYLLIRFYVFILPIVPLLIDTTWRVCYVIIDVTVWLILVPLRVAVFEVGRLERIIIPPNRPIKR